MFKRILVIIFLFTAVINAEITSPPKESTMPDTIFFEWVPSMVAGLNISQISFTNWAKGGQNSFTWVGTFDFGLLYKTYDWTFRNEFKSAYGRTKIGGEEFRTNDNELYNETVFSYNIKWAVDPYVSNTLRTQITRGYDYKKDPPEAIADFFDPAYITQSIGFTYDKLSSFRTRLGVACQETITDEFNSYADDPDTPDEIETFRFETGIENVSQLELMIDDNVQYKSKLRLFSAFENIDVWDVRWDNTLTAKVNSWLNVNLSALMIYEKAQSPHTQLKQALQLGLVYTIY